MTAKNGESETMKRPCVYILASKPNGTLYVGVTADLLRRIWEHRLGSIEGFTKTYGVYLLVHVEFCGTMPEAIRREKQIKKWRRAWKLELIERSNPQWRDLYEEIQH
jgi:putative endonuclease